MAASITPARILVIDIDGLRQDVFHQALSTQRILHLAGLLANSDSGESGCHLDPVSTAPSITFCAQSSIFTGRPPEDHGAVGNQFFDRFGRSGKNSGPRFYALDVGDSLAYDDAVLTFTGEIGLLGQTLNPEVPTLYEIAAQRGADSTVLYHMVSRGGVRVDSPQPGGYCPLYQGGRTDRAGSGAVRHENVGTGPGSPALGSAPRRDDRLFYGPGSHLA